MTPITQLEKQIIELSRLNGSLAETCDLIDYDDRYGAVPEHWRVKHYLMPIFKALVPVIDSEIDQKMKEVMAAVDATYCQDYMQGIG